MFCNVLHNHQNALLLELIHSVSCIVYLRTCTSKYPISLTQLYLFCMQLRRYWRKLQIEKRVKAIGQFRKAVNSISAALNVVNQFKEASVSSVMRLPSLIMRVNTNTPVLNSHREEQSLHKSASTVQKSPSAVKLPPLSNKMVTPRRTVTTDVNDPQSMGRKDWTANFIAAKTENMVGLVLYMGQYVTVI